jgi:hypothetical protein
MHALEPLGSAEKRDLEQQRDDTGSGARACSMLTMAML